MAYESNFQLRCSEEELDEWKTLADRDERLQVLPQNRRLSTFFRMLVMDYKQHRMKQQAAGNRGDSQHATPN